MGAPEDKRTSSNDSQVHAPLGGFRENESDGVQIDGLYTLSDGEYCSLLHRISREMIALLMQDNNASTSQVGLSVQNGKLIFSPKIKLKFGIDALSITPLPNEVSPCIQFPITMPSFPQNSSGLQFPMTNLNLDVSANTVSPNGVGASDLHFPDDIQQGFLPNLVDFDFVAFSDTFGLYPPHLEHNILTTSNQLSMSSPAPQLGFNTVEPTIVQPLMGPCSTLAVQPVPPSAPLVVTPPAAMAPTFYGQPITPPVSIAQVISGAAVSTIDQPVPSSVLVSFPVTSPGSVVQPPTSRATPATSTDVADIRLTRPAIAPQTTADTHTHTNSSPSIFSQLSTATNINKGNTSTTVTETSCHLSSDTLPDSQATIANPSPPQPSALPLEIETRRSSRPVVPSKRVEQMNQIGSKNATTASVSSLEKENIPFGIPPAWAVAAKNHFLIRDLGSEWVTCVGEWFELEALLGYGSQPGTKVRMS